MFNRHDISRNEFQLFGRQSECGYDWWWHSFTAHNASTGKAKSFFIEFFTCNPASGGSEPVFGQIPENRLRGIRPSYLMVKAGCWGEDATQVHRFFGWDDVDIADGFPFSVKAGDCYLDENSTKGNIDVSREGAQANPHWMSGFGKMSWDLKINKITAFNVGYGAGKAMRRLQAFEMFWHAEGMKTEYEGTITWNGEKYIVNPKTCFGYADKNWGKNFTSPWVWLSSCNLTSDISGKRLNDSVFDIGGGRPKIGPVSLSRKLLSAFWYEGRPFEFNFSKFWTFVRTKFRCYEKSEEIVWHIEQRNLLDKMVTDIRCPKSEMLQVKYESPDGEMRHTRLWNGGTGKGTVAIYHSGKLVDRIRVENCGCEWGVFSNN